MFEEVNVMTGTRVRLCAGVLLAFLATSFAPSFMKATPAPQAATGTIEGKVVDVGDGPLVEATVVLTNTRTGEQFNARTGADGSFKFEGLSIDSFRIVATKSGFVEMDRQVSLASDSNRTVEIILPHESTLVIRDRIFVVGDPARSGDIPGSAHFIGPEELDKLKTDFDDIHTFLRRVPGVHMQEEEGYGLRPNIGMRGSGLERNSKITVMEDGILIAPAPYAAPAAYYFPTAGRMEALEVRKGSSQIKYGPRTNGGTLNLVSTSIPTELSAAGSFLLGEDQTRKFHLNLGDSYKNFGWMAETYQFVTDGFKELDGGGDTGYDLEDYLVKLRFNSSPSSSIYQELEIKLGKTEQFGDETYLGLTDEDFEINPRRRYVASQPDFIDTDHEQIQARYFIAPNDFFDFTTVVYRNNFFRNWHKLQSINGTNISTVFDNPDDFAQEIEIARGADSDPDALAIRHNMRNYYSHGFQSVAGLKFGEGAARHLVEIGLRYHEDEEDRFQQEDGYQVINGQSVRTSVGDPGSQANRVSQAEAWAFFVQDEITWNKLTLTPGFRYENVDLVRNDFSRSDPDRSEGPTRVRENSVDVFIPGVGVHYEFTPGFGLYGGVHRGFSPPGPGSTEDTEAEDSINYEIGGRVRSGSFELQSTFFYNDYDNLLGADTLSSGGSGEGDLFNGGEARVFGLEFSGGYDFGEALDSALSIPIFVAYTVTDGEFRNAFESGFEPWGDVEIGDNLPYIPRHQLFTSFAVGSQLWRIRAETNYVSEMRTLAGQGEIDPFRATDSYFLVNLTGEYDIRREDSKFTLFVSLRNLFDEEYIVARRPAGARPGLPRTLTAGLRFNLGR